SKKKGGTEGCSFVGVNTTKITKIKISLFPEIVPLVEIQPRRMSTMISPKEQPPVPLRKMTQRIGI
ncbi:MAG: hypothetical protein MJ117_07145, partial [Lachnospiraceae bacterium]|nr:hypothetical protein [Lachnospiraceae bacterium]